MCFDWKLHFLLLKCDWRRWNAIFSSFFLFLYFIGTRRFKTFWKLVFVYLMAGFGEEFHGSFMSKRWTWQERSVSLLPILRAPFPRPSNTLWVRHIRPFLSLRRLTKGRRKPAESQVLLFFRENSKFRYDGIQLVKVIDPIAEAIVSSCFFAS